MADCSYQRSSTETEMIAEQCIRCAGGLSVGNPSQPSNSLTRRERVGSPAQPARASSYSAEPNPYLTRQPQLSRQLYPDTVFRAIAYRRRQNGRSNQGA